MRTPKTPVIVLILSLISPMLECQAKDIGTGAFAQVAIKKEPRPVTISKLRLPKPKIFRSNPLRKSQILGGTEPSQAVDDEDYIFARNRNKIEIKKYFSFFDFSFFTRFILINCFNFYIISIFGSS